MDLTPISPLPTIERPIVRINGHLIMSENSIDTKPLEKDDKVSTKTTKMYSSPVFSLLMLSSFGMAQQIFEEISLFKQNEESIPVNGWFKVEPYTPIQATPDFFKHFIPESMYQWNLTSISSKTETLNKLSSYAYEVYQRFSVLFKNLAHSGPVLVVILISMTLLILNQFVKERTGHEKEETMKIIPTKKAD